MAGIERTEYVLKSLGSMLSLGAVIKAIDAVATLREAAKRFKDPLADAPDRRPGSQLETTLTNVVVAALKEAFDRDHVRAELERRQLDDERRRAENALRFELRRHAADREIGRLRLLAVIALIGWIASMLVVALSSGLAMPARAVLAAGWVLLFAALGAALHAQARFGASMAEDDGRMETGPAGGAALWLLIAGLAGTAVSMLL